MIQDDLYLFNHHHKIFKAGPVYKQIFYFSMEVHGSMALCKSGRFPQRWIRTIEPMHSKRCSLIFKYQQISHKNALYL